MVELIDTHCHLDLEPLASDVEAVLERARAAGVAQCLSVGTSIESSRANVALAGRYPMLRAAVGVHPHEADSMSDAVFEEIEQLTAEPSVVAIGEVGLDDYRQYASVDHQLRLLNGFIALAQRSNLPLVLHCRQAYEALLDLLRQEGGSQLRGLIHCASGPSEFIQGMLELGLSISFAGNITLLRRKPRPWAGRNARRVLLRSRADKATAKQNTASEPLLRQGFAAASPKLEERRRGFRPTKVPRACPWGSTFPNAQTLRDLVPLVPDERLLIETDAPFLAPQPVRGKKNEPAYVVHTAAYLAQLRGTTTESLGALTSRNARRLFRLPDPTTLRT